MAKSTLVTLLTDFGTRDPYLPAMKGALLRLCPKAQIVDITHDLASYDVLAGAFVLAQAAPQFPPQTLHVVVIDPGVGSQRNILAAQFGGQRFLFPDNGVISLVAEALPLEAMHVVQDKRYVPDDASMTFHGRDIFAPVAAHLLSGLPMSQLGPQPQKYLQLDLPSASADETSLKGQVIYIDHFGNLITNVSMDQIQSRFPNFDLLKVFCGQTEIGPLTGTYSFVPQGAALALINSMGLLEVAVNQGRACDILGTGVGTPVALRTE